MPQIILKTSQLSRWPHLPVALYGSWVAASTQLHGVYDLELRYAHINTTKGCTVLQSPADAPRATTIPFHELEAAIYDDLKDSFTALVPDLGEIPVLVLAPKAIPLLCGGLKMHDIYKRLPIAHSPVAR